MRWVSFFLTAASLTACTEAPAPGPGDPNPPAEVDAGAKVDAKPKVDRPGPGESDADLPPSPVDGSEPPVDGPPGGSADASPGDAAPVAVNTVKLEPPGGTFVGMQMVKLSAGAADAVIRYTIDGSLPSATSPTYSTPLALKETTIIRAFAESPTAGKGKIEAGIFVRAGDDVAAFDSNLPIIVLHTHKAGKLNAAKDTPYVAGSVSVFEPPAGGRTKLVGPATFTSRAGVRIRGNSSREFFQKSYGFELRQEGSDLDDDHVVLGLPSDSDWALIAPSRVDRSLIRNALAFTLSNEIGRYAPRVRTVEVFTVETGVAGALTKQTYVGVYTLVEKIKTNKHRVNVSDVDVNARTEPGITGGYVFRIDHGDPHFSTTGICHCTFDMKPAMPFAVVEPDWDTLSAASRTAFAGYLKNYMQEFFDAVSAADFKNPKTGKHYNQYIDVPSFLDHNLLNALFKNVDGLRLSAYFHKEKGELVKAGPLWDFDRSSGTRFDDDYGRRTEEAKEWARGDGTHPLKWGYYQRLFADPAFKQGYNKRWAELVRGPFSVTHMHELIDKFAAEVKEAQSRHFARWTQYPPSGSHDNEIKIIKDWFAARVPWMDSQLK